MLLLARRSAVDVRRLALVQLRSVIVTAPEGVREELRLNPEEAVHWYRRARVSINDPATRALAPPIADHPDALAVWEYLDRSIDPGIVSRAFRFGPR